MTTIKTTILALVSIAVLGTAITAATSPLDYCDIGKCQPCPTGGCGHTAPINFCCTPAGVCEATENLADCDPDDIAAVCECGQSNADGTITCFEC